MQNVCSACRAGIGDDKSLEAYLVLEYITQKVAVCTAGRAVPGVVSRHYRPCTRFLETGFEGGQVNFPQESFVDVDGI